jgi:hypothetical protein
LGAAAAAVAAGVRAHEEGQAMNQLALVLSVIALALVAAPVLNMVLG